MDFEGFPPFGESPPFILTFILRGMGHGKMQKVEKGMDKAVAKMDEVEAKTKKAVS